MSDRQILAEIFARLHEREDPPRPWTGSGELDWSDSQISQDYARAAARDVEVTRSELEFLISTLEIPLGPSSRQRWNILDLGCGDGRLLLPLAKLGHRGFGIDLGPSPVAGMVEAAKRHELDVTGVVGDLRSWARGESGLEGPAGGYQLALLSFGTFGALRREEAPELLSRVRRELAAGGRVVIEMGMSREFAAELNGRQEWWTAEDFVLGEGPQLVLDDHAFDAETGVYVRRSFAVHLSEPPRVGEVRQTSQLHEAEELAQMVEAAGLKVEALMGDFDAAPYDRDESDDLILVSRRA